MHGDTKQGVICKTLSSHDLQNDTDCLNMPTSLVGTNLLWGLLLLNLVAMQYYQKMKLYGMMYMGPVCTVIVHLMHNMFFLHPGWGLMWPNCEWSCSTCYSSFLVGDNSMFITPEKETILQMIFFSCLFF